MRAPIMATTDCTALRLCECACPYLGIGREEYVVVQQGCWIGCVAGNAVVLSGILHQRVMLGKLSFLLEV